MKAAIRCEDTAERKKKENKTAELSVWSFKGGEGGVPREENTNKTQLLSGCATLNKELRETSHGEREGGGGGAVLPRQPELLPGITRERGEVKAGTKRDAGGGDSQNRLGFPSEQRGDETCSGSR